MATIITSDEFYEVYKASGLEGLKKVITPENINIKNKHGNTLLHTFIANAYMSNLYNYEEISYIISLDLKEGLTGEREDSKREKKDSIINIKDTYGNTPLHLTLKRGLIKLAHLLISKYPNSSPFSFNLKEGLTGEREELTEKREGIKREKEEEQKEEDYINIRDVYGRTPLAMALSNYWLDTARYLLLKGADINIPTFDGDTPLHTAAGMGSLKTVKFILANGGIADICNNKAERPHDVAKTEFIKNYIKKNMIPDVKGAI